MDEIKSPNDSYFEEFELKNSSGANKWKIFEADDTFQDSNYLLLKIKIASSISFLSSYLQSHK